mmetsp:Transcript_73867/g.208514  ORF Transcript_73867/g.208514 Transcript_73867/m.208514 type:complete len:273 (+) Transcript_73867:25-843(+)
MHGGGEPRGGTGCDDIVPRLSGHHLGGRRVHRHAALRRRRRRAQRRHRGPAVEEGDQLQRRQRAEVDEDGGGGCLRRRFARDRREDPVRPRPGGGARGGLDVRAVHELRVRRLRADGRPPRAAHPGGGGLLRRGPHVVLAAPAAREEPAGAREVPRGPPGQGLRLPPQDVPRPRRHPRAAAARHRRLHRRLRQPAVLLGEALASARAGGLPHHCDGRVAVCRGADGLHRRSGELPPEQDTSLRESIREAGPHIRQLDNSLWPGGPGWHGAHK